MPNWTPEIRAQLAGLKLQAARELEIIEEVSQHLNDRYEELLNGGSSEEEARRLVLTEMGSLDLFAQKLKETEHRARRESVALNPAKGNHLENFFRDLRYGARMLGKNPGFTAVAVLTLALGIGANTVMFGVARAVLFRSLGFESEDRLVWIQRLNTQTGARENQLSWQDLEDIRSSTRSFESVVTDNSSDARWEDGDRTADVPVVRATPNLTEVLRLRPTLGRIFLPSDAAEPVALISYELWHSRFGGASNVLGQTVRLDKEVRTIVGVLPAGLQFPIERAPTPGSGSIVKAGQKPFWLPMPPPRGEDQTSRGARMFLGIGRLKSGIPEAVARSELAALAKRLEIEHPDSNRNWSFNIVSFRDQVLGHARQGIPLLTAAVMAVLLICCVNLANLLLARGVSRQRELAVRLALGAGRKRLVYALMMEALLLSALGGGAGIVFAAGALQFIRELASASVPFIREANLDGTVIGFTAGVSLLTAIVFGLLPALRLSRTDAVDALRAGARSTGGLQVRAFQRSLLIGQVALVLVLLSAAGLLLESFRRLTGQDLGYQPRSVVTLDLTTIGFDTNGDICRMYRALRERLAALPGVTAVGTISSAPLTGKWTFNERPDIVGRPVPFVDRPSLAATFVAFDYFQAMGIPLREGRFFRDDELKDDGSGQIVVLNESAAALMFPGRSAIGGLFTVGSNPNRVLEVIGVVKDTRDVRLEEKPQPRFYWQYASGGAQVVVRGTVPASALIPMLRHAVTQTDARVRIDTVRPMTEILASTVAERRFLMIMSATYAILALVIASIGIFGVVAYQAAQRRNEFGVRLALGSSPNGLTCLVLFEAGRLTLIGLVIGLGASFATNRLLASQLFGLSPHDPILLLSISVLLVFVAMLASFLPARRAARVNPVEALRFE